MLILGILECLFTCKICIFFLSRLIFKIFHCFCMFLNKHFINVGVYISKTKQCYNVKRSAHDFYMRAKILLNICICTSVPLKYRVFYKKIFLIRKGASKTPKSLENLLPEMSEIFRFFRELFKS